MTIDEIMSEIKTLNAIEVHVETNDGTYGGTEAVRKCGTGDPRWATRNVYETVGGQVRSTGPSEDRAPGRMRSIGRRELADLRKRVAELRAMLRTAR